MKSVAGSLAWVCRQCRPDLSYRVSRIQSASNNGTVADIKEANKTVEYAVKTYQRGITFRSGLLDWSKPGGLMSLVITDASHANEEEELLVNGSVSVEYHRSQGARMIFVATPSLLGRRQGKRTSNSLGFEHSSESVQKHHPGRGLHLAGRCGGRRRASRSSS